MALEGFGSEVSIGAIALLTLKVVRDFIKERREKRRAVEVVNGDHKDRKDRNPGNPDNPGKSSTSTDLVLHLLTEHGEKIKDLDGHIHKLEGGMGDMRVDLAQVKTRLDMKGEKS